MQMKKYLISLQFNIVAFNFSSIQALFGKIYDFSLTAHLFIIGINKLSMLYKYHSSKMLDMH